MLLSFRATADIIQERRTGSDLAIVLPIRTRTTVALRTAPQPGSIDITTGVTVAIEAADPIGTTLPISVGQLVVQASGTAFRPIRTGVVVTLRSATLPGAIPIEDIGVDVAFTMAGRGFAFNRDLVIAGQTDLPAETLTDVVLLGVNFTDPDFRSLDNGGQLALNSAEDIQFVSLVNGLVFSHNIVSHDQVTGQLIFDLKIPLWAITQDLPIRMFFGNVGQVPGRLNIVAGRVQVGFTAAPPFDFIVVAPLIGLTRTGSQLVRPPASELANTQPGNVAGNVSSNFNFTDITGYNGVTNLTLDFRDRVFYHHSLNSFTGDNGRPGQNSPLRPGNVRNGLCIYGAEIIGEQIDNTLWSTMKTGTTNNSGDEMDDNAILYPNPNTGINVPANATVYIEACVFRKSFDGINTDPHFGNNRDSKPRWIVRGCYAEKQRDEFIENDSCEYLEIYDCLIDDCHNFVSMRPGGSSDAIPPDYSDSDNWVKCYNVLARCRGQYYNLDVSGDPLAFGTKRDPQFGITGSVFVNNPTNYGPGWVHREPWKGDGVETFTNLNATIWLDCRDSIFAIESRPTAGPVVFPPGTYDNVFLLVMFDLPTQGLNLGDFVDSRYVQDRGITVLSGATARAMWAEQRQAWITAHGGFIDTDGLLRFPFHLLPA